MRQAPCRSPQVSRHLRSLVLAQIVDHGEGLPQDKHERDFHHDFRKAF